MSHSGMATAPTSPDAARRRAGGALSGLRGSWVALLVSSVARVLLTMVLGLLLWSVVPVLAGWESSVVMSGSMSPRLQAGDIVLVRPVPPDEFHAGQVLLVDDPDRPGRLRLHRLVKVDADGSLVLKGDANPQADSSGVDPGAAHGVASLRIPALGLASVWLSDERWSALANTGLIFAVTVAGALLFRVDEPTEGAPSPPRPARRRWGFRAGLASGLLVAAVFRAVDDTPLGTGTATVVAASEHTHGSAEDFHSRG